MGICTSFWDVVRASSDTTVIELLNKLNRKVWQATDPGIIKPSWPQGPAVIGRFAQAITCYYVGGVPIDKRKERDEKIQNMVKFRLSDLALKLSRGHTVKAHPHLTMRY